MSDTPHFRLPLLAAAQAQKHVTVNEALVRIDALARPRAVSAVLTDPPVLAAEGETYLVANGAVNGWAGHDGEVAFWVNGGWAFATAQIGWQVWVDAVNAWFVFDGLDWIDSALMVTQEGAATQARIMVSDHVISAGPSNSTSAVIPANSQVTGVTARVTIGITGALGSWRLGVSGSDNRYGSGLGLAQNAYALGLSGAPVTYYSDTPLLLTGEGGDFASGTVRIAVHLTQLQPPRAV